MQAISDRENEVLALVGERLSNAQIAARLFISVRTVESHVSSLLRKLDMVDRQHLAAYGANAIDPQLVGAPRPFTSFVGRQGDIAEVGDALSSARLVTLLGPGGIGKTRLALEAGARYASSAAWFVDLVPVWSGHVDAAVAAAMGVAEQGGRSLLDGVCEELAPVSGLVVLDNCEHVLDDVATLVARILQTCPEMRVLTTSRESLGLIGERIVPVRPLDVGGADSSAVLLFRQRAEAGGGELSVTDMPLIEAVCARLDGIPLAIELAAARCATLGVAGVGDALSDRLRLLVGARGPDARHRSLRDVLDWSHGLLDDDERRVLRRLAVFHGGFRPAEAAAVAGGGADDLLVPDVLGRLAAKSMVAVRPDDDGPVYRLLDTVRAYAADQLDVAGERGSTSDAHLAWSADVAASLAEACAGPQGAPDDADRLVDDLRSAIAWGTANGPNSTTAELARSLGHIQYARFFFVEARRLFDAAADLTDDPADACRDLIDSANCAYTLLLGNVGYERLLAAADRAREAGRDDLVAEALAVVIERSQRYPAELGVAPTHERTLLHLDEAHRRGDGVSPWIDALLTIADTWASTDRPTVTTRESSERALAAAQELDDPVMISCCLDALGSACGAEGKLMAAADISVGRLELLRRLSPFAVRQGGEVLDILHMASDSPLVAGDLPRAMSVVDEISRHPFAGVVTHLVRREQVIALGLTGRFDDAVAAADVMRVAWEGIDRPTAGWMAPAAYLMAMVHGLRGNADAAAEWDEVGSVAASSLVVSMRTVASIRVAIHAGRVADALCALEEYAGADDGSVLDSAGAVCSFDGYLWPLVAETWVMAGRPDADIGIDRVRALVDEHRWASVCLLRAEGRLRGDDTLLTEAADGFDALDASFEAAATRALLPGRVGLDAVATLSSMGCTPPA